MSTPKVVVVIQARMGSNRLAGKMFEPLCDKPLVFHIIERAKHIKSAHKIVLATGEEPGDDPLAEYAKEMDIDLVRGSETNVMQRFLKAIEIHSADIVVRICGDAPLFDPGIVDDQIAALIKENADVPIFQGDSEVAQQGVVAISARALRWSNDVAPDDPLVYEHVTAYAQSHIKELSVVELECDPALAGEYNFSIDTADDLEFIRQIYEELYRPGKIVSLRKAVDLVNKGLAGKSPCRT